MNDRFRTTKDVEDKLNQILGLVAAIHARSGAGILPGNIVRPPTSPIAPRLPEDFLDTGLGQRLDAIDRTLLSLSVRITQVETEIAVQDERWMAMSNRLRAIEAIVTLDPPT